MSRRNRNPKKDYAVYLAVLVFRAIVLRMPFFLMRGTARTLGPMLYYLGGRHRRRVILQMKLAFPEKSDAELRTLAKKSFQHLVMFVFEAVGMSRINEKNVYKFATKETKERLEQFQDKPWLCLSLHLGSFQQFMPVFGICGTKVVAIQRPLDNPYLAKLIVDERETQRGEVFSKYDNLLGLRKYMRQDYTVVSVIDQNGGKRGMFVDFLGFPASTWRSPAELHFAYKIPIWIGSGPRIGLGPKADLIVHGTWEYDPELAKEYKSSPEKKEEITRRMLEWINEKMDEAIRAHPEQWLWQHRRWKARPKDENIPVQDGVPCPWLSDDPAIRAPWTGESVPESAEPDTQAGPHQVPGA